MSQKRMRIGMSIRGVGYHQAAWRHPDEPADGTRRCEHYAHNAQAAELGKCDMNFFTDGIGIRERDARHTFGDLSGYPLDAPGPVDVLGPNEMKSGSERLWERVRREQPTIRQLYEQVAGMGGCCLIGTAADIADVMRAWFQKLACDGFNVTPTHLPGGCEDFVDMVIPQMQRRGLFRTEYEGGALRENLGLKPSVNRYARQRGWRAAE